MTPPLIKAVAAKACKGPAESIFNPISAGVAEAEPAPHGPGGAARLRVGPNWRGPKTVGPRG
jgi:hypothetical protein